LQGQVPSPGQSPVQQPPVPSPSRPPPFQGQTYPLPYQGQYPAQQPAGSPPASRQLEHPQLQAVTRAVLTLQKLNAFSFPAQQVAAQIVDAVGRLSRSPEEPQPEAVEHLVNSTRHLLLSVCPGAVNVLPDPSNEENQLARINILKERHARLVRECSDLKSSAKDLTSRHEETVAALTQTIENMMKALKTDGNPEAAAIAEQAVYVTNAIREREMLTKELESESERRREREDEVLQLRDNLLQKSNELDYLTQKSMELASKVESLQLKLSHSEANNALSGQTAAEEESRISALTRELSESQRLVNSLQAKTDRLQLYARELENKAILKELEHPIQYALLSPFLIFDSFCPGPPRMSLKPADAIVAMPPKPVSEKIRVKFTSAPKVTIPAPSANPSTHRPIHSISLFAPRDLVPIASDQGVVYVPDGQVSASRPESEQPSASLSEKPIIGSIVFQKTYLNARRQLLRMENMLQLKNHELFELRDQLLRYKSQAADSRHRENQAFHDLRKARHSCAQINDELQAAYVVIGRRDTEIQELRALIAQIKRRVDPVIIQAAIHRINTDEQQTATANEYRRRVIQHEMNVTYSISPALKAMMERQVRAMEKWHERRVSLQKKQRGELVAILEGIGLISPRAVQRLSSQGSRLQLRPNTPSPARAPQIQAKPITLTSIAHTSQRPATQQRGSGGTRQGYGVPTKSSDSALIRSIRPYQVLESTLARGIIGKPIPILKS
jgi:hypothetical protein